MADSYSTELTGTRLSREFLHIAKLANNAHGVVCDATQSIRIHGLWRCRDNQGQELCEVDGRSGSVTLIEPIDLLPPEGMLDRVRDLRRAGYSSLTIQGWLGGWVRSRDPVREAALALQLATAIMSDRRR